MEGDLQKILKEMKECALKAVTADEKKNNEEAIKYYLETITKLTIAIKLDNNTYNKEAFKKKGFEYGKRVKELKELGIGNPNGNPQPNVSPDKKKEEPKKEEPKKDETKKDEKNVKKEDKKEDEETKKLQEMLASCIVTEKPNVKWEDVAGLEKAKESLKEAIILPLKFPQLFVGKRKPWKGILLYGPPGTGKSFLAKACATETNGTFFSVAASNIVSKWMGEAERLVRALFDLARAKKPSVIFIDEIDSLLTNRSEGENESTRRIKTEFLVQMNGVGKDDEGILVLGATNIPWELDPAARRRFQRKIYISLPDGEARRAMIKLNLGNTENNLSEEDYDELTGKTEGFSGSDIYTLTQDAIYEPLRKCQHAKYFKKIGEFYLPCSPSDQGAMQMNLYEIPDSTKLLTPPVTLEDYISALVKIKPTVSEKDLEKQDEFTESFGSEG